MLVEHFDSVAPVLSTMGSILWAHNGRFAKYTGLFWLLASLVWLVFAIYTKNLTLGGCQVFNILLTLYGCRDWLKAMTCKFAKCRGSCFEARVLD
jgi:hypothetical protein